MEPIVIKSGCVRLTLLFFGLIALMLVLFGIAAVPVEDVGVTVKVVGWIALPIIFYCVMQTSLMLFSKRPLLIIDSNGITHNSTVGFVPWSDVVGAVLTQYRNQKFLYIAIGRSENYLKKVNVLKRILLQMSLASEGIFIRIPQFLIPMPLETVEQHIQRGMETHWEQLVAGANLLLGELEQKLNNKGLPGT